MWQFNLIKKSQTHICTLLTYLNTIFPKSISMIGSLGLKCSVPRKKKSVSEKNEARALRKIAKFKLVSLSFETWPHNFTHLSITADGRKQYR